MVLKLGSQVFLGIVLCRCLEICQVVKMEGKYLRIKKFKPKKIRNYNNEGLDNKKTETKNSLRDEPITIFGQLTSITLLAQTSFPNC